MPSIVQQRVGRRPDSWGMEYFLGDIDEALVLDEEFDDVDQQDTHLLESLQRTAAW